MEWNGIYVEKEEKKNKEKKQIKDNKQTNENTKDDFVNVCGNFYDYIEFRKKNSLFFNEDVFFFLLISLLNIKGN
jgi:hypothetical protein